MTNEKYTSSPMNYTGNKYKLLPQLLPLFPKGICTFYDMCCGSLCVSMNVVADKYVCNDIDYHLIDLYKRMQQSDTFVQDVCTILDTYGLRDASVDDPDAFFRMREAYNENRDSETFFAVITQCYNSIISYTSQGDCNSSYGHGKSGKCPGLSDKRLNNLIALIKWLKDKDVTLLNHSFTDIKVSNDAFVYVDPPYLITLAAYNKTWNNVSEYAMYRYLDELTAMNIRWGMSNVLYNRGVCHVKLRNWSTKYNIIPIDHKYGSLAASDRKPTKTETKEVYICNY